MSESSAQALRRSRREPEAFVGFYRAHVDALLRYMVRRVCDAEAALDLTAESFAQAYIARRRFRGQTEEEAVAWLYRIAQRQLARYYRRAKTERRALRRLGIEPPRLDDERQARIEELAESEGAREAVRRELTRLSPAKREAVELRVVEELPYAEVARRLEISEGTARVRVTRGLKTLALALDQQHPFPEEARR